MKFTRVLLLLLAGTYAAHASVSLVTNAAGITATGQIDWGVLGANFTVVAQPFATPVPGIGGLTVTVSQASGPFERRDQGAGWSGNFAGGAKLLWSRDDTNNNSTTLVFSSAVQGAGAQIQRDQFGAFTAKIEAFDAQDVSLGCFTVPGSSTSAGDNSAIFVGLLSTAVDIKKLVFSVLGTPGGFAINGPRVGGPSGSPIGGSTGSPCAATGGCGVHTVHGHISTVPPGHYSGIAFHNHHGQHGHTAPPDCFDHLPSPHPLPPPNDVIGHGRASDVGAKLSVDSGAGLLGPEPGMPDLHFPAALNQDGTLNGIVGNQDAAAFTVSAARRGTVLQMFGLAAGLYMPEHGDQPALAFTPPVSGSPLYYTTALPEVRIGGVAAKVLFSGLAPGLTGVWQINVLIPQGTPSGRVPVSVSYEGEELKSVSVAVE